VSAAPLVVKLTLKSLAKYSVPKNIGETLPFPFRITQLDGLIELEGSPRARLRLMPMIQSDGGVAGGMLSKFSVRQVLEPEEKKSPSVSSRFELIPIYGLGEVLTGATPASR
jgi:hypothetical protein